MEGYINLSDVPQQSQVRAFASANIKSWVQLGWII